MKKLYTNIITEIIAPHGFHPAVVETEYHRSQKFRRDMLCRRIMSEVLVWKTSNKGNALIAQVYEQGWMSEDDMIELLKEYMQTMYQFGHAVQWPTYLGMRF